MSEDGTAWVLIYFGLIHRAGVGRFQGGTGAITNALARCFAAAGGEVRFGAEVETLLVSRGRVHGLRLVGGEEVHASAVLTTNNVKVPLTRWLPEDALTPAMKERVRHIPTSSTHASSFKVDVALSGRLTLGQHQANRTDGVDLRKPALVWASFSDHVEAWESCARGEVPDGLPGVGIIPTGMDPSQAPEGQDTFWWWTGISPVRPRVPWSELAEPTAERLLASAGRYIDGLKELEIDRQVNTPVTLEARFRSPDGNVYHVDPTATRFGPLRPAVGFAGYKSPIDGLYLSGGGTHPSAGICGVPGQQAARAVLRSMRTA
jgi:phytoene dehydrogenase-like protein